MKLTMRSIFFLVVILFFQSISGAQVNSERYRRMGSAFDRKSSIMYNRGIESIKAGDYEKGISELHESAERNFYQAWYTLASLYADPGRPCFDYSKSAECLQQMVERFSSNSARYQLSLFYLTGRGVEQDIDKAFDFMQQAAEKNFGPAMHELGRFYLMGTGTTVDALEASRWFATAAEKYQIAKSYYSLALLYEKGVGVEQNKDLAMSNFLSAAEKGMVEAMYTLGDRLERGVLGDSDIEQAIAWYSKCAELGYPQGMTRLALIYADTSSSRFAPRRVIHLLTQAASLGDANAIEYLGTLELPIPELADSMNYPQSNSVEAPVLHQIDSADVGTTSTVVYDYKRPFMLPASEDSNSDEFDIERLLYEGNIDAEIRELQKVSAFDRGDSAIPRFLCLSFDLINTARSDYDRALKIAKLIITKANPQDRFFLLFYNAKGINYNDQGFIDGQTALNFLDEVHNYDFARKDIYGRPEKTGNPVIDGDEPDQGFRNQASVQQQMAQPASFNNYSVGIHWLSKMFSKIDRPVYAVLFAPGVNAEKSEFQEEFISLLKQAGVYPLSVQTTIVNKEVLASADSWGATSGALKLNPLKKNLVWPTMVEIANASDGKAYGKELTIESIVDDILKISGTYYEITIRYFTDPEEMEERGSVKIKDSEQELLPLDKKK